MNKRRRKSGDDGIEIVMTRSGDIHFPSGRPSEAAAAPFLSAAVERVHLLLDRLAGALGTGGADADTIGRELGDAITNLQIAAAMFSTAVPTDAATDLTRDEDDDAPFWTADGADALVPPGELPRSVPLNIALSEGDYTVRVRDAHVYSSGFLLTVDVRLRVGDDVGEDMLGWLDHRLSGRWGSSLKPPGREAIPYTPGWGTPPSTPGFVRGEWRFWVETTNDRDVEFELMDPIDDRLSVWRFTIAASVIDSGRLLDGRSDLRTQKTNTDGADASPTLTDPN